MGQAQGADMQITRRGWFGLSAAGAAALATSPASAGAYSPGHVDIPAARFRVVSPGKRAYGAALEALAAYARAELLALGLPGMTLSVTDSDGFTALLALGWADVCAHAPIREDQLFQIGSISKSFLALCVLSLADEGKINLDAPLSTYLPDAPWPDAPVTLAQALSHTGGLPDGAPIFPRTPDGRLWTGFLGGSKFSYSNTGYDLLGRAVTHVTGLSHEEAIRERVRHPLGVDDIAGRIHQAVRDRCPSAYFGANDLAVDTPGVAMIEAPWDPEDTPAGSIAATSEMMARYLRGLLKLGAGQGAGVLTPASAKRFATGVIASDADFGPGSRYACGVALQPVDGSDCLHHTGGMIAFHSSFHADPAAGVAAFASVNGGLGSYRPRATTAYAIRLMRAVRAGAPLPAAPDPLAAWKIKDVSPFVGHWFGPDDGEAITIASGGDLPMVSGMDSAGLLYRTGGGAATPHRFLSRHTLEAAPDGRLWWGEVLLGRDAPTPQPAVPERLRAFTGMYLNRDPWAGYVEVMARGETLVLDGLGPIVDRGGYWSGEKDVGGVERVRFEGMLNGRAMRLNLSGTDFLRVEV
jgi:CubicO group peptidase (beta-lactamase class C family)